MRQLRWIFITILIVHCGHLAEEQEAFPLGSAKFLSSAPPAYGATPLPLLPKDAERDRLIEELKHKQIAPEQPADFFSLRSRADALAAKQSSSFKLHQVGTELEFASGAARMEEAMGSTIGILQVTEQESLRYK